MQNKRGISQAFSHGWEGRVIRRATVFDVFDMSAVLQASIRELCQDDHQNDPERLAEWADSKTPATIRSWLDGPGELWVIEDEGRIAAVGGLGAVEGTEGLITLNYVSPDFRFRGLSSALLDHLEARLWALGARIARLEGTKTAMPFYLARGWQADDAPCGECRAECTALVKQLSRDVNGA